MLMEIRLHGRGGQGGVTCAKILAAVYAASGKSVQTFGDYAGERSGAPVRAYTRVSDAPIENRNKVYEPDHLLVLDPHLIGPDVFAGLRPGGTVLLNTSQPLSAFADRWREFTLATVDATKIARAHRIGSKSVVIVNTTIAGAFVRLQGLDIALLEKTYQKLGFLGNLAAAKEAWESVQIRPAQLVGVSVAATAAPGSNGSLPEIMPLEEHTASPPLLLKTGNWGTQRPHYVENLAPCNAWCPAGNDVIGFVQSLHGDDAQKGAEILFRSTPLPGVCGRVCPAPCMEGCNRAEYDGAVDIRGLERWIADARPRRTNGASARAAGQHAAGKRIAVVGGGPAGLSAAFELGKLGHRVTIFEGERQLGGVLRTGIPTYRLPRDVLDREVEDVTALGVEVRAGRFLQRVELAALPREFDGVILATGLQKLTRLDVDGAALPGVEQGIHFLHRVNLAGPVRLEGHVVVLGGGNTAMDCARSALRCGASRVTIAYRRTRAEMPAIREEVDEALEEGIVLLEQRAPAAVRGDGAVQAIELAAVEMGPPDASGRRRPVVTDRVERLPCDHVLLALGQSADQSLLPDGWELRQGQVFASGQALPVFLAGDLATGDGTVTHAIGSGRRAAGLVLRTLGLDVPVFERPDRTRAVPSTDIRFDHFAPRPPAQLPRASAAQRRHDFAEVSTGLADAAEAHRCFSCGHCTRCDTCLVYCPEGIIRRQAPDEHGNYAVDYSYCKGCGICVEECPRRAMEMSES
jgi:2-oxoacid:acceptor oxidoreductase gamma subunit (pyruvate/2-ketoisovalerate family)/2-oxoacid:acceptor oxidoreductase delta subunit (pyruvate/2-ketoisovalerate family)